MEGKIGKFHRLFAVEADHQNEDGDGDIERQTEVKQHGRQRHDHQHEDADQSRRGHDIAVPQQIHDSGAIKHALYAGYFHQRFPFSEYT